MGAEMPSVTVPVNTATLRNDNKNETREACLYGCEETRGGYIHIHSSSWIMIRGCRNNGTDGVFWLLGKGSRHTQIQISAPKFHESATSRLLTFCTIFVAGGRKGRRASVSTTGPSGGKAFYIYM